MLRLPSRLLGFLVPALFGNLGIASTALAQSPPIAPLPSAIDYNSDPANLLSNTPFTVIIPVVGSRMLNVVNPGDATLVLRLTATITNAWYDAAAPYDDNAIGLVYNTRRRPAPKRTDRSRNIAVVYSSFPVIESLVPQFASDWRALRVLADDALGSPEDRRAKAIGLAAGRAVMASRLQDGMNQLGDEDGSAYNLQPYSDYTSYAPVNTAYHLSDIRRWQPAVKTEGNGLFTVQQFVTPQMELTRPFLGAYPNLTAPPPTRSFAARGNGKFPRAAYVEQVDEVLRASAALTDEQKMTGEVFEDKINSLGLSIAVASAQQGLTLQEFLEVDFLVNAAAFDTAIVIWREKRRYDAVRPFSAVREVYGNTTITAWGGPGQGTVSDITGNEWQSYLPVANHPEYPSATASFCAAHATAADAYLTDRDPANAGVLNWSAQLPLPFTGMPGIQPGSSFVEPGVTPATLIQLDYPQWDDLKRDCGLSRFWTGVHFFDAVPAGQAIGEVVGAASYQALLPYFEGTATP